MIRLICLPECRRPQWLWLLGLAQQNPCRGAFMSHSWTFEVKAYAGVFNYSWERAVVELWWLPELRTLRALRALKVQAPKRTLPIPACCELQGCVAAMRQCCQDKQLLASTKTPNPASEKLQLCEIAVCILGAQPVPRLHITISTPALLSLSAEMEFLGNIAFWHHMSPWLCEAEHYGLLLIMTAHRDTCGAEQWCVAGLWRQKAPVCTSVTV